MVVAFHTLMLADCSPCSMLLERLWGINWNGSTRSWGEPRTCCNLLEPDSTQFVGPVGATLDGKILTKLRSDLPRNLYIVKHLVKHFVKHVTCCETFWIFGALIGFWIGIAISMNQYEYVGCAKALLVWQCLQVHGWAGGRTDACSWGSMGDQVQDSVYM